MFFLENKITTYSISFSKNDFNTDLVITTSSLSILHFSKKEIKRHAIESHSNGDIFKAIYYYQFFLDLGFSDPEVFAYYGVILKGSKQLGKAIEILEQGIKLFPEHPTSYNNLGNIFRENNKLKEAEILIRKAIQIKPNYAMAYNNLGSVKKDLDQLLEAEYFTRKAIQIDPCLFLANLNLAIILKDLGSISEAESFACIALDLNPNDPDAHFNLSLIQLLKGNYNNGLENFEYRSKVKYPALPHANPNIKRFSKINKFTHEKLLIISEQGFGDTLQFMRYVPYLKRMGLDISFCANKKLHSIIKTSRIDSNPLTLKQGNFVKDGKWISLLSLPKLLKVNPCNPIINEPYIHSTDELMQKWKFILSKEKCPIIGINWQGNRNAEQNSLKGRSIPLEKFSFIAKNTSIKLLSLQKGYGSDQLDNCSFNNKFVNCQSEVEKIWDFLEIASIIANCDLIITSDTYVAHLAGGMGKLTWLLLKDVPEWRWGLSSNTTFWYPSIKLFRQKVRNNWSELMERVSNELSSIY